MLLLAALLAILTPFVLWPMRRSSEPRYGGRSLSSWLDESCAPTMVRQHQATQAILQIGTNALPHLFQHIKYNQPAWRNATTPQFATLRGLPLAGRFIPRLLYLDRAAVRAEMAVYALGAMGQTAAPAHPDLVRLACDATQTAASERAIRILTWTGSTATNAVGLLLSNAPPNIRMKTLNYIAVQHDQSILQALRPALIHQLHDADDNVAVSAASILTWLKHTQPEATLALFVETLGSPKPKVRIEAIKGIATFDRFALQAVPSVVPLLTDTDFSVRKQATNFVLMLAPEMLTNAPRH